MAGIVLSRGSRVAKPLYILFFSLLVVGWWYCCYCKGRSWFDGLFLFAAPCSLSSLGNSLVIDQTNNQYYKVTSRVLCHHFYAQNGRQGRHRSGTIRHSCQGRTKVDVIIDVAKKVC